MKIIDLIQHYDAVKSAHGSIGPSLSPKIVQLMAMFGQLPASSRGVDLVAHCRKAMPHAKPNTIARVLSQLRAVFKAAERDDLILKAPHIPLPTYNDVRAQQISVSEAKLVMKHLAWTAPHDYPLAMVLLHTGCRLSEALRLTPESIRDGAIHFDKPALGRTKSTSRVVDFTPDLAQLVKSRNPHTVRWDFMQPAAMLQQNATREEATKRAKVVASRLGRHIDSACEALGLPTIRLHDLRHTFAAMVAEAGGDLADTSALLGHSDPRSTMRYRGLVRSRTRKILSLA
ncbi:XerC Integrase [uncultured Caudovirales phage]|uniref:Integrase n=1 Tax=uncultured Caudovirales phage TaxID=2100421 RepID=A0A6J5NPU0_9CAUD|nr:XerC Integrase [uncultured Caudovirales phage]